MHCGMPKGTSRAEAMSSNEKNKPVALDVIKLKAYLLSQSVENSVKYIYFKFRSISGRSENLFGLSFT